MSGMFERIARRHPDRSEEQVAAENADESATDSPVADGTGSDVPADAAQPADVTGVVPAAEDTPGEATTDLPDVDAPTEQIEAVAPPSVDQPSAPPPAVDLTTRLAATPAAPVAGAAVAAHAPAGQGDAAPTAETVVTPPAPRRPGFRARGRMRRRLRYLRKLRELQARDLGGLVFDLRRFERKRDDLIAQKIDHIRACDDELRALELALRERRDLRDIREPGIGGTCPRCFAVFGSADRFCANCGAALGGAVQGPAQVPLAPTAPPAQPAPAAPPPPAAQPEAGRGGPQQ